MNVPVLARAAALARRQKPLTLLAVGLAGIAGLGVADYLAGPDLSFLVFYVAPVLFLVWFGGETLGLAGIVACAGIWVYEDLLSPHAEPSDSVAAWNIAVRVLFFLLFVYTVARLKGALERERAAAQERLERDVRIAKQVQARLFPQATPEIAGLDLHGVCRPVQGVAGDYYDYLPLGPSRLGVAVGDVAGKGIPAALLMASLQASLRSFASLRGENVAEVARDVSAQLHALMERNRFATLFWGVFDGEERRLTYVNAGHNPPMLLRGDGSVVRLRSGGPPLGVFPTASYRPETVTLGGGDLLTIYTDGITEAADPTDAEFGEARLEQLLRGSPGLPAAEICRRVLEDVDVFRGAAPQNDDMTVVVMRVTGT